MLSVSNLVRVTVNLSPTAAAVRSFGTLMIAGDSDVISGLERFRTYLNIEGVAADFGVDDPEYQAALLYFGQTPKPGTLMIGRWLRTASAAQNLGGILSPAEQVISNWTSISAGTLIVSVNGSTQTLTGLDFTAVTNLNGVASIITAALSGGATCAWNGSYFVITSGTSGAGVQATGTVTFDTNAANADTLTLNGVAFTFKTSPTLSHDVLIGASKEATAANLQVLLNTLTDAGLIVANYATVLNVLTVTYKVVGTGGNSYTVAKSSSHISISGATLTGGTVASSVGYATGTISAQMKLTTALSQDLVIGYNAESPVECAAVLANLSAAWYGLMFQASTQPTDDQNVAVAAFIEAVELKRIFGVTITNTNVLSALVSTDLATRLMDLGYKQSFVQYSQNAYAIASFFGRGFTVDFTANNTTMTLMFKQEPGVTGEDLNANQSLVLKNKRCNVFVDYVNDTVILQYGVMSGPAYFDEVHGLDWLQDAIQTANYNVLYLSPTKIPQTDAGVNQLTNATDAVLTQAVANGLVAPGTWNGPSFGELKTGQFLKTGYYIYTPSVALQSQSDRDARIAPTQQVAIKLAGAIQAVNVIVDVNR